MTIHSFDHLSIEFYTAAKKDKRASREAARPIYKDVEMFRARIAGDPTRTIVAPAHEQFLQIKVPTVKTGWTDRYDILDDDEGDDDQKGFWTYAEAFPEHYAIFKKTSERTQVGTPIEHLPWLSKRRMAELKNRGVESVEGLATLSDSFLRDCGPTTREEREQAKVWLNKSEQMAVVSQANADRAVLEAKVAEMPAQMAKLLEQGIAKAEPIYANDPDNPRTWDYDSLKTYLAKQKAPARANASRDKLLEAVLSLFEMPEVVEDEDIDA